MDDLRRDDYFSRVCSAVEYADEHLGEDLDLAALADVACFSPRHFHRIFTSLLGETPDDCVRRLRLQKAAGLILSRDSPTMTEVALECGFSTSALFSRNFSKAYGASPTDWRDGKKRQAKVAYRQVPVPSGKDRAASFRYLIGQEEEEVEVDILEIPAFTVHCVPYLQGYNVGIGNAFIRLARWARPRGLLSEDSRIIAIPFDNPATTPPQRCRNYAGIIAGSGGRNAEGSRGVVRTLEMRGGAYIRASTEGAQWSLHSLYRFLYEIAIPELGFASFGGKGFIEYPGKAERLARSPSRDSEGSASTRSLVHVPVRPAG